MADFYSRTLKSALEAGLLRTDDNVLVVCGGKRDQNAFLENGFTNVTVSNLSVRGGYPQEPVDYPGYRLEYQDAEDLTYDDDSFDFAVVRHGLHHCASPHRGLCEMLRVARKGVGVFESRDSILMRAAVRLGLADNYELEPIVNLRGDSKNEGGYRGSAIPNRIYRWTERDFVKAIDTYLPQYRHKYWYFYGYTAPVERMASSTSMVKRWMAALTASALPVLERLIPSQGNDFAMFATKRGPLQPWLRESDDGVVTDYDALALKYKRTWYRRS